MRKTSISRRVFLAVDAIIMILLMIVCLYPLIYVCIASVSDSIKLVANTGLLWKPLGFNLEAYRAVVKNPMAVSGYMNTVIVLVCGVTLNIFMTSLAAYFLSRRSEIMLKGPIMAMMIFTMYFSGGMIPGFINIKNLGLYNSLLALILPGAISTYNLIIMRTSFQSIPASLEEAAHLDGASHFSILWHIILPLSKAIIAVMILYYGVGIWNSWFPASIYLNDRSKYPLQLVLREILLQNDVSNMAQNAGVAESYSVSESIKYAVVVVATLPILCIYPFLQKYFVKGVMIGALKG